VFLGVSKELSWLSLTFGLALVIGWLVDSLSSVVFLYLVFYILRNLLSMHNFERWVAGEKKAPYPSASGFWNEIGSAISIKNRTSENKISQHSYKTEQFKEALMRLEDAIISLDEKGKIEWFNLAARDKLKLTDSDITIHIEFLLRIPKFVSYLQKGDYAVPLILAVLKGVPRTVSIVIVRYYKNHKLIIIKDIHQLYNIAQIRKDFIANASHELRTPLTVINGYVEMMADANVDNGKWQKPLDQMNSQSKRMQSIISDLLTLSSLEAEQLSEELSVIDVPKLLNEQQETSLGMLKEEQQIIFDIDPNLSMQGYVTPLTSIFANLISNAIRYSPKTGLIKVKWYQAKEHIFFEVEDNGIGIPREHLARITERFYRVDMARSREHGGTGLGLSIVKYSLEKHKGSLIVESQYGKGSTFICEFPIELAVKS